MSDKGGSDTLIDELLLPVREKRLRRLPRLIWRSIELLMRAAPKEFIAASTLQLTAGAAVAAQLLVGRRVLSGVLALGGGGPGSFGRLLPDLIALTLISTLVFFAAVARTEQQRVLADLVARYAMQKVIQAAAAVDLIAYETPSFHNRLQRAQVNAAVRPLQMANGVLGIVSSLFAIGGITVALLLLQPAFFILVLLGGLPAWFAARRAARLTYDFSVRQTERDRRRSYLLQLLCGKEEAKEVRAFGLGSFLARSHDRLFDERIVELRRMCNHRLRIGLAAALGTSVLTASALAVLIWLVVTARMSVATAGAVGGGIFFLGQRLRDLSSSAGSLYESSLFVEDFSTFVESMPVIRAARASGSPPRTFSNLVVDKVSFSYPSSEEPTLQKVSLEIHAGEVVALVGENGSGKTTLAKLLAGLYVPESGTITWDGVDTAECDPDLLRDSVAVIFQDFVKYFLTVRENIAMGRHERLEDLEGIIDAARLAGTHEDILRLHGGYDTRLGPHFFGGSDLSVGQWQRVALARMFFRDAPFIILDEPTAALDPRAEAKLFDSIRDLFYGRTVLVISHRFSSVRWADRIYVLDQGRIVEHGTHQELIDRKGLYAQLFNLQASAYADAEKAQGAGAG